MFDFLIPPNISGILSSYYFECVSDFKNVSNTYIVLFKIQLLQRQYTRAMLGISIHGFITFKVLDLISNILQGVPASRGFVREIKTA